MITYTVGQRLFWKSNGYGRAKDLDIEVTKVGRRWVEWECPELAWRGRFDKATGAEDGGGYTSPGHVWPSRRAWEQRALTEAAIVALYHCTSYPGLPSDVGSETWTLLKLAADTIGVGEKWRKEFEARTKAWRTEP